MVRGNPFFVLSDVRTHFCQDLIFKNQAMSSRKTEGGKFVNDLLRTEFHKYVHTKTKLRIEVYTKRQEIYDQVYQGMSQRIVTRLAPSNHITSVTCTPCFPNRTTYICFHSLHPPIYSIKSCPTSILPRPNQAYPFRRIRDLWYTSTHVEKCTVSPA